MLIMRLKLALAFVVILLLYTHIDQTLVNSLYGLLHCEIGGVDCRVSTTEYRTLVHCIHMLHLFCNCMYFIREYLVSVLIQYMCFTLGITIAHDMHSLELCVGCIRQVFKYCYVCRT